MRNGSQGWRCLHKLLRPLDEYGSLLCDALALVILMRWFHCVLSCQGHGWCLTYGPEEVITIVPDYVENYWIPAKELVLPSLVQLFPMYTVLVATTLLRVLYVVPAPLGVPCSSVLYYSLGPVHKMKV